MRILGRRSSTGPDLGARGFRSVERVRVYRAGGRVVAEATGVLHRYPRTVRISLATAARLADAGAPLSVELTPFPEGAS